MSLRLSQIWLPIGRIGRARYLIFGLVLFGIKHNIDRLLASSVFGRPWGLFNYWFPIPNLDIQHVPADQAYFLWLMLLASIPFIYAGVCLTVARLRDTRLPLWLVVFFFLPYLNLLFFLILSMIPTHSEKRGAQDHQPDWFDRMIPYGPFGSAVAGITVTLPAGALLVGMSYSFFNNYGWALFAGIPFFMGFMSAVVYNHHYQRSVWGSIGVAMLSVFLLSCVLFLIAFEGIICILMSAPIALPMAIFGGFIGQAIRRRPEDRPETSRMFSIMVLALPAMMGIEKAEAPEAPLFEVKTSIEVNAPPEKVWKHVVSFSELPPPTEWIFRTGIAYPTHAEIEGTGVGALRRCNFTTGCFTEPIEVWDQPRLLRFSVTSNPPPMKEITIYSDIHPPHLDGYLVSKRGQFLLTPLADGRTRLEGTTWYHHGLWPAEYWRVWSDPIIHAIHIRVLKHVKQLSESNGHNKQPS